MSVSPRTLITDALIEIGVCAESQSPSSPDAARSLRILNRDIMDGWNVIKPFATHRVITSGSFAASTVTRTIGPTGSYVLTTRPAELLDAHWVDSSGNRYPISIRDGDWYSSLTMPAFSSTIISDIAYFPTAPNGTMYPWPIPSAIVTVEIETRSILAQFADLDTAVDFAQGYERAITQTLKELLCRAFRRPLPDGLREDARDARAAIQIQNLSPRRPLRTDAPSTCSGPVGSDIIETRTRSY